MKKVIVEKAKREVGIKAAVFLAVVGLCAFIRIDILFRVFCVVMIADAVFD